MKFIELTQIAPEPHASCMDPKAKSKIIGKVFIPLDILKNSIIQEDCDLAAPEGFYQPEKIDYEISTSQLFVNFSGFPTGTIDVAENFKAIFHEIELLENG